MKPKKDSKSSQKRILKEKELHESSWKLADSMYTDIWGDRWAALKAELIKDQTYCKSAKTKLEPSDDTVETFGNIQYVPVDSDGSTDTDLSYFTVDKEALFLYNLFAPTVGDNILGTHRKPYSTGSDI